MSKSWYEYTWTFEQFDTCLKETYIVIRIDGKGFHSFSQENNFEKPNDLKALTVMSNSAKKVCEKFNDIFLAYGQSDEFSFAILKNSNLYKRRKEKLLSLIVSAFTSNYLFYFFEIF